MYNYIYNNKNTKIVKFKGHIALDSPCYDD